MDLPKARPVGYVNSGSLQIPIRNVWLLLLYASNLFRSLAPESVDTEHDPDEIPDLVAEVLAYQVDLRLRRNLTIGYRSKRDDLTRLRGRIDFLRTERHQLLRRGRIACHFDELTIDTPRNRFVLMALLAISPVVKSRELGRRCRHLATILSHAGVSTNTIRRLDIHAAQFTRNDSHDKPMIDAAKLAIDLALPLEDSGLARIGIHSTDERWMRDLFEKAVGGFYKVVLPSAFWSVATGERLSWPISGESAGLRTLVPIMITDIVITDRVRNSRLVIDTKFTSLTKAGKGGQDRLRSAYIYQMYAYLRSQEVANDERSIVSSGLLLHPSVGEAYDEYMVVNDHMIRFATVDLGGTADQIRKTLLEVIRAAHA